MREPTCPLNGIRRYGRADVVRLRFIKPAQQAGFALAEIESLLGLTGRAACRATRNVAAQKLAAIEERI
jgi:MerR family transcriptional regulator, mercuric resistance operon regulatory protein